MSPFSHSPQSLSVPMARGEILPYLRKVYFFFTAGVVSAALGALIALYGGMPIQMAVPGGMLTVPPLVAFGMQHWFLSLIGYIAIFFGATYLRRVPGLNLLALIGYTVATGIFLAPALFVAQLVASSGSSLDPSPVRDAFLLSGGAFAGLTTYVFLSRRDFSFIGGAISMGLFVLLGATLLSFFFHSQAFDLAIASVGVIVFCGYILFDTSKILRDQEEDDAIGAALRLFLDVVNLFLFLLRILSSSRQR